MDLLNDYSAYRLSRERVAALHREADAHRLTRTLAEQHAALFPRARRFAAGLVGLAAVRPASGATNAKAVGPRGGSTAATAPEPCPC